MFNPTRIQITLKGTPERVFRALTTPTEMQAWFSEHADVDLTAARYDFWGKYTHGAPDREAGKHDLISSEANRELTFRWRLHSGYDTLVTYKLIPQGDDATMLLMRHLPDPEQAQQPEGWESLDDFWFVVLENLRRYLDGKPSDMRVDFTNPMKGDIRVQTEIDAPASRVFEVLTNPDELNRWIATKAEVHPEVGGLYDWGWAEGSSVMKILEITPGQKLSAQGPVEYPTVVTWEMEENGGKTRLTFTHSGFADDADNAGIYMGWHNFMNWVRSVSEYGAAWQPPMPLIKPDAIAFPASIYNGQSQIVEELKVGA
jgi:uncharacterized protein YndB with AHSA1/START domain